MQNEKSFKDIQTIAKNTLRALKYSSIFIKDGFKIDKSFKGISYLIFDKEYKLYLALPDMDYFSEKNKAQENINFTVFALEESENKLSHNYMGDILTVRSGPLYKVKFDDKVKNEYEKQLKKFLFKFGMRREELLKAIKKQEFLKREIDRRERIDQLAILEIIKKEYISRGLGKEMYKLFEYNSFIMGAKRMNGIMATINPDFIDKQNLRRFYEDRGIKLDINNKMKKQYNMAEMKAYAKRIATFSKDGIIIKIIFPENTKQRVLDLVHKNSKEKNKAVFKVKDFSKIF